ncbi:MAG: type I-C CRISPR-associated protein Cas5c [Planctomycetota bacterium]
MSDENTLAVKIWGPFACFTRPEMKVERVSYDVPPPSAARGMLEAIFWKPEFSWRVRQIEVLRPVKRVSILRNELKRKASSRGDNKDFFADDNRTQRNTLALRDVSYIIRATVKLRPKGKGEHPEKYRAQFRRRVKKGQCYHRPVLGCREFAAQFAPPAGNESPIDLTTDLGRMLFDIDYQDGKKGRGSPRFFNARLEKGVLQVPQDMYKSMEG